MKLNKQELLSVTGGAVNWTIVSIIGTIISLVAGIADGYLNPVKCSR